MTDKEITFLVQIAQRAPLRNLLEAQRLTTVLEKLIKHFAPAESADKKE